MRTKEKQINLGIVSLAIDQHGGAEIYLMECMRRWQSHAQLTLYSTSIDDRLLAEFGVDVDRMERVILPKWDNKKNRPFDLVEDLVILPRIWEQHLQRHDAYLLNGCPTHFVRCSPSVFMCHEPLRILYDLRFQTGSPTDATEIHLYPEQEYRQGDVRELDIQLGLIESLERQTSFDHLAVTSKATARYAENVYRRAADLVAYPGVNPVTQVDRPSSGKRALFIGRLWSSKRVSLLIRAMALLEDGHLDIVGKGPEKQRLQQLAENLQIAERVVFHGSLSCEELKELYTEVTCGVYVPLREPFGMVPLEVAAVGLPVIVAPEGGYSEILGEASAIVVDPNPKAIANALDRVFRDPDYAAERGARAAASVGSVTWDRTAADLLSLIKKTAGTVTPLDYKQRPFVGAHYYPWYDAGRPRRHWNENREYAAVTDTPLEGMYTSRDLKTIQRHLRLAEEAGIDFLIINLEIGRFGIHPADLEATRRILEEAETRSSAVRIAVMAIIHTRQEEPLQAAFKEIQSFAESKYWMHHRAEPLLWLFFSADLLGSYFMNQKVLEKACGAFSVIASGGICDPRNLPSEIQQFFAGWSLYNPFNSPRSKEWMEYAKKAYRTHLTSKGDPIRTFTLAPGYDDRHLSAEGREKGRVRHVDRKQGSTYQQMFAIAEALDPPPELVLITSFNEYHENTHIEPSYNFDSDYIRLTAEFTARLKHGKQQPTPCIN